MRRWPQAQQEQDGLVNLIIGDITVEDVNVRVAAQVVATICGVQVGPVAVLGRAVDRSGGSHVECERQGNEIGFEQN